MVRMSKTDASRRSAGAVHAGLTWMSVTTMSYGVARAPAPATLSTVARTISTPSSPSLAVCTAAPAATNLRAITCR